MFIFVSILLACGLLYWLVQSILLIWTLLVIPDCRLRTRHESDSDSLVSVIIPARNEQSVFEQAMQSRLADPDERLRFILIDDRSTDSTGTIMDYLSTVDERVLVEHVQNLPEGWLGKVNAMQVGLHHAEGDWVLLSDADVHVAPGMVWSAIDHAEKHSIDHLAVIPEIRSRSLGLRLCLSPLQRALVLLTRLWAVSDPTSDAAMGVGAFNLVRRDVLEASGGCEALRMEIFDDVGLSVIVKQHGGRSSIAFGRAGLSIAWYDRFGDFLQGMERGAAKRPPWCPRLLLALAVLLVTFLDLSPFLAIGAWGFSSFIGWIGLYFSLWAMFLSIVLARRFGTNAFFAALVPLNTVLMALVALHVVFRGGQGDTIQWRGTTYNMNELRQGERVRVYGRT